MFNFVAYSSISMRLWYPQRIKQTIFVQVLYDDIKCQYGPSLSNLTIKTRTTWHPTTFISTMICKWNGECTQNLHTQYVIIQRNNMSLFCSVFSLGHVQIKSNPYTASNSSTSHPFLCYESTIRKWLVRF